VKHAIIVRFDVPIQWWNTACLCDCYY